MNVNHENIIACNDCTNSKYNKNVQLRVGIRIAQKHTCQKSCAAMLELPKFSCLLIEWECCIISGRWHFNEYILMIYAMSCANSAFSLLNLLYLCYFRYLKRKEKMFQVLNPSPYLPLLVSYPWPKYWVVDTILRLVILILDRIYSQQSKEGQDIHPEQIKAVLLDSAGFHGMI